MILLPEWFRCHLGYEMAGFPHIAGTEFRRPLTAMRDYLTIVRGLFRDASVQHSGPMFSAAFGFLGFRPPADVPIMC